MDVSYERHVVIKMTEDDAAELYAALHNSTGAVSASSVLSDLKIELGDLIN